MKSTIRNTFSIAVVSFAALVGTQGAIAGEFVKPGVNVQQVVAKQMVLGQQSKPGFAWDRTESNTSTAISGTAEDTSGFRWETAGTQQAVAALASGSYSQASQSENKGFIWGIRNAADQQGFIWGIRNTAEQQGFIWGIRNDADQQGFIWGIRNDADQQGFIWGIRNDADQQGFIWGIRNDADQQGFIWGIRNDAEQQGFIWGIR